MKYISLLNFNLNYFLYFFILKKIIISNIFMNLTKIFKYAVIIEKK